MKNVKKIRQFRPSRWWSNVQALRADAGFSEKDLSLYIGKKENYLTQAIRNGGCPNITDALAIADLFEVTIEELAFGSLGLEIRKAQLEAELKRITEEIEDAQRDITSPKTI